ncbi:MAG: DUF447 family protein [Desulfurococcaceae archaeon]
MVFIRDNVLYEGVLSTLFDSKPYLAPVGFIKDNDFVEMRIYKGTFLHEVLNKVNYVVINITHDPLMYFLSCFKEEVGNAVYHDYVFLDEKGVPRLINALGYIDLALLTKENRDEYTLFRYRVKGIYDNDNYIRRVEPYTRCYSSIIEALIYLSKIRFMVRRDLNEAMKMLDNFERSLEIAKKTCKNRQYSELVERIKTVARKWVRNY